MNSQAGMSSLLLPPTLSSYSPSFSPLYLTTSSSCVTQKNVIPFRLLFSGDGNRIKFAKIVKKKQKKQTKTKRTMNVPLKLIMHDLRLLFYLCPSKSKKESDTVFEWSVPDCHSCRCLWVFNWLVNAVHKSRSASRFYLAVSALTGCL